MSRLRRRSAAVGANEIRRDSLLPPLGRRELFEADVLYRREPVRQPWSPVSLFERRAREVRRQDFGVMRQRFVARARPVPRRDVPVLSPVLQIGVPSRVRFCVNRAARREVLFATGRAGRRGRQSEHRWNASSNWRC